METTTCLIGRIIKLTTCMKRCKHKTFRTDSFFMHAYRDSTAIILYSSRTVSLQGNRNCITVSSKMFIYCIVYNFIYEMIQSFGRYASDIHTGSFSDCLKSFQYSNTGGIISGFLFHFKNLFLFLWLQLFAAGYRKCTGANMARNT